MAVGIKIYSRNKVNDQWNVIWSVRRTVEPDEPSDSQMASLIEDNVGQYCGDRLNRIVEAGCGSGKWLPWLETVYSGAHIYGIDYSDVAVKYSREVATRAKVDCGDVTKLPYDDNFFDLYLSFGVIEHLENEADVLLALAEAHRVLGSGGIAVISVPGFFPINIFRGLKNLVKVPLIKSGLLRAHFFEYLFFPSKIVRIIEKSGFEIVSQEIERHPQVLSRMLLGFGWIFPSISNHMAVYVLRKR